MNNYKLLISPEAKGAYFADYLKLAKAELEFCTGLTAHLETTGPLSFVAVECEPSQLAQLARLSFCQGIFLTEGKSLTPLDLSPAYHLPLDFIFGSKFRGKTNERLTQLLINLALSQTEQPAKILDPMCGRGTTLLWAMAYGLKARGIEQDSRALLDIEQICKKWSKIHGLKLNYQHGFTQKKNKKGEGKFLEVAQGESSFKVVSGDSRQASHLMRDEKFNAIISDLPYGVQHFTTDKTRNPLHVLEQAVPEWIRLLREEGVIVLAYNSYLPKRAAMLELFQGLGFEALNFAGSHRMSESIVRDVLVFKKIRAST